MFDEPLDPPKLIDLLEREFLPQFHTPTAYQYRHSITKLAISLGYQPTPRDLRGYVIDWLENWLTIHGHGRKSVQSVVQRVHKICSWYALRQLERGPRT